MDHSRDHFNRRKLGNQKRLQNDRRVSILRSVAGVLFRFALGLDGPIYFCRGKTLFVTSLGCGGGSPSKRRMIAAISSRVRVGSSSSVVSTLYCGRPDRESSFWGRLGRCPYAYEIPKFHFAKPRRWRTSRTSLRCIGSGGGCLSGNLNVAAVGYCGSRLTTLCAAAAA